ncbi:cytoskeleton protein RodZ [Aliidiomarina sp. Khilg15.8]
MTDPEQHNTPDEITADIPSPGAMLRQGRERMQLSQKDVAQRLRLRLAIIEDLEQDRLNKHVASTFTRGYLRAYARLVQVDEAELFKAYEQLDLEAQGVQPMQSFSRRTSQQTHDNRLMAVTYIIGAVIIGSAVIFWWQNSAEEEAALNSEPVSERLVDEQDPRVELEPSQPEEVSSGAYEPILIDPNVVPPSDEEVMETAVDEDMRGDVEAPAEDEPAEPVQAEEAQDEPEQRSETVSEESAPPEEEIAAAQTEEATAENVATTEALPDSELVLAFEGECWIRIEDSTGQAIAFGVKRPGQVVALDGEAPYQVTLGAPQNVRMVFRGDDVDLSGYRSGRVVRIDLPRTE